MKSSVTAVILAAGKSSRLGFERPKVLQEVAGRVMLFYVLELGLQVAQRNILVVSPRYASGT